MLEIFNNRFMSIAEQMGFTLQNTAASVNIRERLDFSCALFDAGGNLIANAPHIPVHLGAMDQGVKAVLGGLEEHHAARRRFSAQLAVSRRHPSARFDRGQPGLFRRRQGFIVFYRVAGSSRRHRRQNPRLDSAGQ